MDTQNKVIDLVESDEQTLDRLNLTKQTKLFTYINPSEDTPYTTLYKVYFE